MDGVNDIYMDNFGFGLGMDILLTILATEVFLDIDESPFNDRKETGTVDFDVAKTAAFAYLYTHKKSLSGYCSVLTLYHLYLLILQDC